MAEEQLTEGAQVRGEEAPVHESRACDEAPTAAFDVCGVRGVSGVTVAASGAVPYARVLALEREVVHATCNVRVVDQAIVTVAQELERLQQLKAVRVATLAQARAERDRVMGFGSNEPRSSFLGYPLTVPQRLRDDIFTVARAAMASNSTQVSISSLRLQEMAYALETTLSGPGTSTPEESLSNAAWPLTSAVFFAGTMRWAGIDGSTASPSSSRGPVGTPEASHPRSRSRSRSPTLSFGRRSMN